MEVIAYFALTSLWWASTFSILLPFAVALKLSKTFNSKWYAWLFARACVARHEAGQRPFRIQCFDLLKKRLQSRDKTVPLKVLEIGIGSGLNLDLYPENSSLVALDVNPEFGKFFEENRKRYPEVRLEKVVRCSAEDMSELDDGSVDVVVSTYVLCSVANNESALKEIRRVLKPGGLFVFLEHVGYPPSSWNRTLQRMTTPLWVFFFAGCSIDRDILEDIKKANFSEVEHREFEASSMPLYLRSQLMGIAVK